MSRCTFCSGMSEMTREERPLFSHDLANVALEMNRNDTAVCVSLEQEVEDWEGWLNAVSYPH